MAYVTVGKENSSDIQLYYEDHGSGDPVVLIHGYPLNSASWEKQIPVLLEAGQRVVSYDRRGFGKSSQPTTGYNYDTFAEDLHKLVTHLKLRNFALVGFSMGGGEVARYIGKRGSKGVSKAVIIGGIPPYLLKTTDNADGVDANVFEGIQKAVAADRYAFFSEFFKNFFNTDAFATGASGYVANVPDLNQQFMASWTRNLSSRMVNEARVSFGRLNTEFGGNNIGNTIPNDGQIDQALANVIFQAPGLLGFGPATNAPQGRIVNTY